MPLTFLPGVTRAERGGVRLWRASKLDMDAFQLELLDDIQAGFLSGGYVTRFTEETAELPATLRVGAGDIGKIKQEVLFEFFFTPGLSADEENPYSVLNVVCTLFHDLPPEHYDELDKASMLCNRRLLIGSLGTLRMNNCLCLRDSMIIRHSYPPEVYLQMPIDSFMAIITSLQVLIDGLAVVARGMRTAEQAEQEGLLG